MAFPIKRPKYRNQRGGGFDSKREAKMIAGLELAKRAADPRERVVTIQRQVKYELVPAQRSSAGKLLERAVTYTADAVVEYADGRVEVIDAKGFRTQQYVIRRKLMLFLRGIRVREV